MKTTDTQATPAEIAKQIADKAATEITSLQAQLQALQSKSEQLHQEREQILVNQAQRADHLRSLHNHVAKVEAEHRDAVSYASVAEGTMGEKEAFRQVNDLAKFLTVVRADVERYAPEYAGLDTTTTARLAEIDADLQNYTAEQSQVHSRLMEVERVSARAIRELGDATYENVQQEYQTYEEKIEALREQIVDLQIQKVGFLERAQEKLAPWPDHQRQLKEREGFSDPTSRIIQAARDYVERLIEDGPAITNRMNVQAVNYANGNNWLVLLEVPRHDLFVNEHITMGKRHRGLNRRLEILNDLLNQYVDSKR